MGLDVVVLYNDDTGLAHGLASDAIAVTSVQHSAQAIAETLLKLGYQTRLVPLQRAWRALAATINDLSADVVFNFVEVLGGEARLEAAVAWMLELRGLAFTGSAPETLSLALDKGRSKAVLQHQGVPVAPGIVLQRGDEILPKGLFPAIVKPTREDASHGIDDASIVNNVDQARARARWVIDSYQQPALVEHFLPGREFNVGVLGPWESARCLDLAEIDFSNWTAAGPPLVSYAAKWDEDSEAFRKTPSIQARPLAPALAEEIRKTALDAYRALGLRDYGRVDIRLDANQRPHVLEVNPNPDISPDAGLARAAQRSGLSYAQLINNVTQHAAERIGAFAPTSARQ